MTEKMCTIEIKERCQRHVIAHLKEIDQLPELNYIETDIWLVYIIPFVFPAKPANPTSFKEAIQNNSREISTLQSRADLLDKVAYLALVEIREDGSLIDVTFKEAKQIIAQLEDRGP